LDIVIGQQGLAKSFLGKTASEKKVCKMNPFPPDTVLSGDTGKMSFGSSAVSSTGG